MHDVSQRMKEMCVRLVLPTDYVSSACELKGASTLSPPDLCHVLVSQMRLMAAGGSKKQQEACVITCKRAPCFRLSERIARPGWQGVYKAYVGVAGGI